MTAIERAEALLKAVETKRPACDCIKSHEQGCPVMLWHRRQADARILLNVEAPKLLRGYIAAVKVVDDAHGFCCEELQQHRGPCTTDNCQMQEAIADFERLFSEDSHSCIPGTYPDCCYPEETPASAD